VLFNKEMSIVSCNEELDELINQRGLYAPEYTRDQLLTGTTSDISRFAPDPQLFTSKELSLLILSRILSRIQFNLLVKAI